MKNILLLIIALFIFKIKAQVKKEIFVNEDFKSISKKQFHEKLINRYYYFYKIENDSVTTFVKVPTSKFGRISNKKYEKVIASLSNYTNRKIDTNKYIIINYFPSLDSCMGKRKWSRYFLVKTKKYLRKIKKRKDIQQIFIFKDNSAIKNFGKYFNYYIDSEQTIEKELFKFHYPCFSYIIIKPNKTFYTKRGEYNISEILEKI